MTPTTTSPRCAADYGHSGRPARQPWDICPPWWHCRHSLNGPDRYPGGRSKQRTGSSTGLVRRTVEIGSWDIPLAKQQEAMGIDWMTLEELSEAIPPAYTELIGHQLIAHLQHELSNRSHTSDPDTAPCNACTPR